MTEERKYWHTNDEENVIESICPCGFKDRPENFHAIQEFSDPTQDSKLYPVS